MSSSALRCTAAEALPELLLTHMAPSPLPPSFPIRPSWQSCGATCWSPLAVAAVALAPDSTCRRVGALSVVSAAKRCWGWLLAGWQEGWRAYGAWLSGSVLPAWISCDVPPAA